MNYQTHELPECFSDGEPLIPEGWISFMWTGLDDNYDDPRVIEDSCPKVGQIVALLSDKRICPPDAYMTKMLNKLEAPQPKNTLDQILIPMFYAKSRIRKVYLARYMGLDSSGYPSFAPVGLGTDRPNDTGERSYSTSLETYMVAWQPIAIPYLPDVEI